MFNLRLAGSHRSTPALPPPRWREHAARTSALIAALTLMLSVLTATVATADGRDGECEKQELCFYYNSNNKGSVSDFAGSLLSVPNYGTRQPTCYDFKGFGNGQGKCIKNKVASVWNRTDKTI